MQTYEQMTETELMQAHWNYSGALAKAKARYKILRDETPNASAADYKSAVATAKDEVAGHRLELRRIERAAKFAA